jgi:hypothetical protein
MILILLNFLLNFDTSLTRVVCIHTYIYIHTQAIENMYVHEIINTFRMSSQFVIISDFRLH